MTTIITKNSSTASAAPSTGDLVKGELAINVTDKKLYTKDNSSAVVKIVGSLGNQEANAVAITGGSIAGITDLAIADGGTGQSTANAAFNALAPAQTGNSGKYLTTNGTDTSWATNPLGTVTSIDVSGGTTGLTTSGGPVTSSGTITLAGTLAVANGGTGVTTSTGTGNNVLSNSPTLVTPALGTPSALVGTNITGTAAGLTAGNVTTNASLTGAVTSVGNATSLGSFTSAQLATALSDETGSGSAVFATSPTLVTPILGTPTSGNFSTGTFTWPTFNQNTTGTAANITASSNSTLTTLSALSLPGSQVSGNISGNAANVTGTVATANGGTGLTSFTANGVVYASSTSALATGSALTFDGTTLANDAASSGGVIGFSASNSVALGYTALTLKNTGASGKTYEIGVGGNGTAGNYQNNLYFRDTTGNPIIALNTTNTIFSAGGSEQMRLTSTGLVIGTSSTDRALTVYTTDSSGKIALFSNGYLNTNVYISADPASGSGVINVSNNAATAAFPLMFQMNGTERMRLDTAGNLGIGTSSPATKLHVNSGAFDEVARFEGTGSPYLSLYRSGTRQFYIYNTSAATGLIVEPALPLTFATSGTERMRLDASGNLLVGTTSNASNARLRVYSSGAYVMEAERETTASATQIAFKNPNGIVGTIETSGTTTSYVTSSDYRLKNITGPITTSGAYIDSLNPVEGTWKADGSTFVGLIAHEAQEASRTVVATGVKDGEQMQGMDYSSAEIIANLIAEIQDLRKRLAALEAA